jgi:hypothetical protein
LVMTDPRFFRQYLDILNEGPPAGVGPNAPVQKTAATTNTQAATPQNPSNWDQAKAAVGQQVQNYKDISADVDAAVKQGGLDPKIAGQAKGHLAGTMMKGGYEAGKAALTGRDPSAAYAGSMMKDVGNLAANSGLDAQMKKVAPEMNQYRGPNAKDIRQTPDFQKASPEQQAQALKDFEAIKNLPDDQWNYYTGGNAFKELGGQAAAAGQGMIDQKDWGTGRSAGYTPAGNELFGLDPTRQATDAEWDAAAKGTNEELERMKKFINR